MHFNEPAMWNCAHCCLIIFYLFQSFLYEEAKYDQHTSLLRVALWKIQNNEKTIYKLPLCKLALIL